jgi:hypothetical protein
MFAQSLPSGVYLGRGGRACKGVAGMLRGCWAPLRFQHSEAFHFGHWRDLMGSHAFLITSQDTLT